MLASTRRSLRVRRGAGLLLATVLLAVLLPVPVALADATLTTPASASISVDTASPGGNGAYTTLTGPVITEGAPGDITPGGNVILTAPANWEFQAGSSVTVTKGIAAGTACPLTVTSPVTATASTITTTLGGSPSTAADRCVLSFAGIKVRPTTTNLPNTDTITISYSGSAAIAGLSSGSSVGTLTAVAGAPVLTFTTQPGTPTVSAVAFSPQPKVHVVDQFGHVRAGDSVVLSIKAGTGTSGATLSCTATTVVTDGSGDAQFAGCKIDKAGSGYVLRATDTTSVGTGTADSAPVTITPGPAAKIAFVTQPGRGTPTTALSPQPAVAIEDAQGNVVTSGASAPITLTKNAPALGGPGSLTGCSANPLTTVGGVATFSGCRVDAVGVGYTLTASAPSYTSVPSNAFDVADRLVMTTPPAGAVGGVAFTTQPVVAVRAGATNTAVNDQATQVTLSISGGTVGATLTCTANPVTVVNGVATFAGCKIDKAGTYTVTATASGLTSASATLTVVAGPAAKVAFVAQPGTSIVSQAFAIQPVVAIQDLGGNTVTTGAAATAVVTLSLGANPGGGTLTCTGGLSKAAVLGVALFTGCSIDRAGNGYTLVATASGLTSATSSPFNVTQPPAQITLTTSASVITWGSGIVLSVQFGANGANKTFQLQGTRDGVNWSTIATLATDASGRASLAYRPATNLYYRAVFTGTPDLLPGTSATVRTVVRQIALLRPTNGGAVKFIARNSSITFTTTVRPARPELTPAKVTFYFYRRVSGAWTLAAKRDVYIDAAGLARTTFKFSATGQWYVRSWANPTPYNANSVMSPLERYSVS